MTITLASLWNGGPLSCAFICLAFGHVALTPLGVADMLQLQLTPLGVAELCFPPDMALPVHRPP